MKITNRQLSILAQDVWLRHFKPAYDKEVAAFTKAKKKLTLTKAEQQVCKNAENAMKAFNKLYKETGSTYNYNSASGLENTILNLKRGKLKFKPTVPQQNQIESDMLLAMLDAKDINQLIDSIKSKYKLK